MAEQLSTGLRDAMIGQYETFIGSAPKLQLRTGAPPSNCAAAAAGTLIDTITLPADWLSAPSAGTVSKAGTWAGTGAAAAGTVGHYRLTDSAGTTCHAHGTVTITGGGGDLTLDNTSVALSQVVTVTSWSRTQGGA